MRKILLVILLPLLSILLQAQETAVIVGVTFSADKKTLIKYPEEKEDQEYIVPEGTEIISYKAFSNNNYLKKITIPSSIQEICSRAFTYCNSLSDIVWGAYPTLVGQDIFWESPTKNFSITTDNQDCTIVNGVLYSKDKKRLLRVPVMSQYYDVTILEGTEIIGKGACELTDISIILPSTLKKIEDFAFWICIRIPTRSKELDYSDYDFGEYRIPSEIQCNALIPPEIIGTPFSPTTYYIPCRLTVPEESLLAYCCAPGWKEFEYINGVRPDHLNSIDKISSYNTKIRVNDQSLKITSEKDIQRIKLVSQEGKIIFDEFARSKSYQIQLDHTSNGVLLLKVIYNNSEEEVFKLIK